MDASTLTSNLQNTIQWVQTNPLIVTLMSGGAVVWLFSNIRNIWRMIVSAISTVISFNIYNTYEDSRAESYGVQNLKIRQEIFNDLVTKSKTLWERTVNLDLNGGGNDLCIDVNYNAAKEAASNDKNIHSFARLRESLLTATYGFSIKILFGKLCFVNRSYKQDGMKIIVNTTIKVFFAKKKPFMAKLEDFIRKYQLKLFDQMRKNDYVYIDNYETFSSAKYKRNLSSIFTDGDVHIELYKDIKKFLDNKDIYRKLNYPYNYCALLHGVPGSGKSSTLLAIATELKRNIVYINLATTTAQRLLKNLNNSPQESIYVFEDIDAVSTKSTIGRTKTDKSMKDMLADDVLLKSLSLSDLLNITDGLLASDGTICLFTTNHIEKLDPAFLRAGRMNKIIEYKYMSSSTAQKMIHFYLNVEIDDLKDEIKPPELQEMILDVLTEKKTFNDLKSAFCKGIM